MNMCVVITVTMIMLLRDFGPYGIIFTTMCIYYFSVAVFLDGLFIGNIVIP
jgi:hypothetical protein